jgi:hypothetical protein
MDLDILNEHLKTRQLYVTFTDADRDLFKSNDIKNKRIKTLKEFIVGITIMGIIILIIYC